MDRKEKKAIRKEQNKIAEEFLVKLKKNFDPSELHQSGGFIYAGEWYFKYNEYAFELAGYYLWQIYKEEENGDKIPLNCGHRIRQKISSFLQGEWDKKQENLKREKLLAELSPAREAIESSFSQSTVEIHETLQQNGRERTKGTTE